MSDSRSETFRFSPRRLSQSISAILLLGGSIVTPAHAQEAATPDNIQEIAITGSRIRSSGFTTPTPVTTVDAGELDKMSPGNMIEAVSQLPQFFGNTTPNSPGNFFTSPGAGNLNIRGLGTNRTLTLLDGRRMPSTNRQGSVDINIFPAALMQRIEIVTGGASAAYGTDAVAGVSNFILNKEFVGIEVSAEGRMTAEADNENGEISFAFGTEIGNRGHVIFSAEYYEQDGVFDYDGRDWFDSYGTVTNPDWLASGQGPRDLIRPNVFSTQATLNGVINAPGTPIHRLEFFPDGSVSPFQLGDPAVVGTGTRSHSITNGGSGTPNSNSRPTLAPDADRSSIFLYGDFDVTDNMTVYGQFIRGTNNWKAANLGGVFQNTTQMTIFQENAFLPGDIRQTMADEGIDSFVFDRIGGPADLAASAFVETENTTKAYTLGFDADIDWDGPLNGWRVSAYVQKGENEHRATQIGGIRLDRIFASIDAVRDSNGNIVCNASLVDPANFSDCIPINLFGAGQASQAALDYVIGFDPGQRITTPVSFSDSGFARGAVLDYVTGADKLTTADMEQTVAEFSADGPIMEGWAGTISGAFGASYREEEIVQLTFDPTNPTGSFDARPVDLAALRAVPGGASARTTTIQFASVPNIAGGFDVKEAFFELQLPLLADLPGVQQLDTSLAARWADYSGSGEIWAWKVGGDWQIYDDLRLRGTVSRDIRAATLAERFDRTGGTTSFDDPEFGNAQLDASLATGGNPNVAPEEADTLTIGAVYQPSWLEGFSVSADWYEIDIEGSIGQLGVQRIIDDCFMGAQNLCEQISRDPVTNRVTLVENIFLNIDAAKVSGIDMEMSYLRPVNFIGRDNESIRWSFFGTYLDENSITNLGAPTVDRAGEVGGQSLPEFKVTTSVNYDVGPVTAFLQLRYIDSGYLDADEEQGIDIDDNTVNSVTYTDFRLSYTRDNANGSSFEVFGHVANLFDEEPPVAASFSTFTGTASQSNANLYDILGRRYTVGVRFRY